MDAILGRAAKNNGQVFKTRLTKFARAYVGFALKHPALCGLMFEAKHRHGAPKELLQASDKAFSHGRALFADGQASGEVVEGDPNRLALVAYASLQGLISISTDGKFKGIFRNLESCSSSSSCSSSVPWDSVTAKRPMELICSVSLIAKRSGFSRTRTTPQTRN